jgi:tripartite ATP-independent transporter DctP family solute receptor
MSAKRAVLVFLLVTAFTMLHLPCEAATEVKLGHIWAPDHPLAQGAAKLAQEMDKASNGQVKIQLFPASQLGSEVEQWEAVATGLQHMTIGGSAFKWDPRFTLLDIPYAVKDLGHLRRVWASPVGQELTQTLIQKGNLRVLGTWYYGTRQLTTSKKPVRTPADMKGFKLRIPDIEAHRVAWTAIGAHPTPIAFSETYMALRTGTVDGQENPLASIGAMKFHEVQKYLVMTNHVTQALTVVINEKFYQSLPANTQQLLQKLVADVTPYHEDLEYQAQKKWLKTFTDAGMQVIEPDVDAFRKASAGVGAFFTEKYGWGDLWPRVQALR